MGKDRAVTGLAFAILLPMLFAVIYLMAAAIGWGLTYAADVVWSIGPGTGSTDLLILGFAVMAVFWPWTVALIWGIGKGINDYILHDKDEEEDLESEITKVFNITHIPKHSRVIFTLPEGLSIKQGEKAMGFTREAMEKAGIKGMVVSGGVKVDVIGVDDGPPTVTCDICEGSGRYGEDRCHTCNATGRMGA